MDNHGTPEQINSGLSQIRRYVALQIPYLGWPFGGTMDPALGVPLSNRRRGKQTVEAPEPSSRRTNTEAENVADENNRAIANVGNISNDSALNPVMEFANEDSVRGNVGNDFAPNPVMELPNVSPCPNERAQAEDSARAYEEARQRKGKMVVSAEAKPKGKPAVSQVPSGLVIREQENGERESESDSEDDAAIQESLNTHAFASAGAEYDRELEVAFLESLKTHASQREMTANIGNIGNDSASNHVMKLANVSLCSNEDSIDEGAQIEALEADIGKFIEPTESMPRPPVSSRGRLLKPTAKKLELPNATGASLPLKRKRKDGTSVDRRTKQKAVKPTPAVSRFDEGDITLNRRPRGLFRRQDVSEPRGLESVVGQASLANGMAHQADVDFPNVSGAGVEVGVPEQSGSGSGLGQASGANGVTRQVDVVDPNRSGADVEAETPEPSRANGLTRQADVADPNRSGAGVSQQLLEPMVCVMNTNPMDLTIEEAIRYMRREDRVGSAQKVKLFGTYIS